MISETRARTVATALGATIERDRSIDTTWRIEVPSARGQLLLQMSTVLLDGGLRMAQAYHWLSLRASVPVALPEGVSVRPPRRTVFDWRDGTPGESPTHTTPSARVLFVEGLERGAIDERALFAWVDSLPAGVTLVLLDASTVELRAAGVIASDPLVAARSMLRAVDRIARTE